MSSDILISSDIKIFPSSEFRAIMLLKVHPLMGRLRFSVVKERFMQNDTTRQCSHIGEDGIQCKAAPMRRKQYCFFHDPAMKTKRLAASRDGGLKRGQRTLASLRLPPDMFTKRLEFHTYADIAELLRRVMVGLCDGSVNPLLASIVEQLVKTMLQARRRAEHDHDHDEDWADFVTTGKGAVDNLVAERLLSRLTEETGA
jgi:hypothetical protein